MKTCSLDTLSQSSEVHHIDLFYFCRALYWGASQSKQYGSRFMELLLLASCQQTQLWPGNGTICRPLYTWQHTSSCLPSTVVSTWRSVWRILATFKRTCTLSAHQLYSVIVRSDFVQSYCQLIISILQLTSLCYKLMSRSMSRSLVCQMLVHQYVLAMLFQEHSLSLQRLAENCVRTLKHR